MSSEKESKSVAVINCSQVVTLAGPARPRVGPGLRELGIIARGAMLVRDGLIERVAAAAEIERAIDANTTVIDADLGAAWTEASRSFALEPATLELGSLLNASARVSLANVPRQVFSPI